MTKESNLIHNRKLDHLVYCVLDLNRAIERIFKQTGVEATLGGRHLKHGTKNALIHLGELSYLELLAIDNSNSTVKGPRWMGIDLISEPKITRWAIHSKDLLSDRVLLKSYNSNMGNLIDGSRKKQDGSILQWEMLMPLAHPEVEIIPFMIDWSKSDAHPTNGLQQNCRLEELKFYGPNNQKTKDALQAIDNNVQIHEYKDIAIQAIIEGPRGKMKL